MLTPIAPSGAPQLMGQRRMHGIVVQPSVWRHPGTRLHCGDETMG
ncbi:hypothetical protein [Streptomyces shenzhenensis]